MSIKLDRDLARDLIESKIQQLDQKINEILNRWNIRSIDDFLEKTRNGELIEGVSDAVSLRNLVDKRTELFNKLTQEDLI